MTVQAEMTDALKDAFHPSMLTVENESHRHNVPPNSETHFKVTWSASYSRVSGACDVINLSTRFSATGWLVRFMHLHSTRIPPKSGMQLVFHLHRLIAAVARASNER